ncbi:unnamed protein product [Thelazia callipaeda]|uniref:FANCI_S4 domain-containing protein n=1 Tax=Thelazia callipaeda TaxID=103827 RepID=A0A0N5D997_THECL|nr:unnamed protein product [Thelazia callipaeda]
MMLSKAMSVSQVSDAALTLVYAVQRIELLRVKNDNVQLKAIDFLEQLINEYSQLLRDNTRNSSVFQMAARKTVQPQFENKKKKPVKKENPVTRQSKRQKKKPKGLKFEK